MPWCSTTRWWTTVPVATATARCRGYWETISPLHNITATAPPTVFFLGTSDALIPGSVGENYQAAMAALGLRCDLPLYQGQPHSFFNYDVPGDSSGPFHGYRDTLFRTDEFLVSLGWLADPHDASAPVTGWVTITGDAGFAGGSAATASPVTTDADGDAIAAGFDPITLADGGFVRLTGSVTFNAPLKGDGFRIDLFDGNNPVTPGAGGGNTFKTGSAPSDVSWVGPDSSSTNNTQWNKRGATNEGNGDTLFQGSVTAGNTLPELTTRITGLADGTTAIWAFYWDQVDSTTRNWILSAGLTSGSLATCSSPGNPDRYLHRQHARIRARRVHHHAQPHRGPGRRPDPRRDR